MPEVGIWTILFGQLGFNAGAYGALDYIRIISNILTVYWFIIIPISLFYLIFARIITYILSALLLAAGVLYILTTRGFIDLTLDGFISDFITIDIAQKFSEIELSNQFAIVVTMLLSMTLVIIFRRIVLKLSVVFLSGFCLVVTLFTLSYLLGQTETLIPAGLDFVAGITYFQFWFLIPFIITFVLQFFIIPDSKIKKIREPEVTPQRQEPTIKM